MWHYFFGWYIGSIWGNLIASLIWGIPTWIWGRKHIKRIHRKQAEMHQHIQEIHNKVHEGVVNNGNTN